MVRYAYFDHKNGQYVATSTNKHYLLDRESRDKMIHDQLSGQAIRDDTDNFFGGNTQSAG